MKRHWYSFVLVLICTLQSFGMHKHNSALIQSQLQEIEALLEAARNTMPIFHISGPEQSPFPAPVASLPPLATLNLPRPALMGQPEPRHREPLVLPAYEQSAPPLVSQKKLEHIGTEKPESKIQKTSFQSTFRYKDKRGVRKPKHPNSCVFSQFDPDEQVNFS